MMRVNFRFAENDRWFSQVDIRDYEAGIAMGGLGIGILLSFSYIMFLLYSALVLIVSLAKFSMHQSDEKTHSGFLSAFILVSLIPAIFFLPPTFILFKLILVALIIVLFVDLILAILSFRDAESIRFYDKIAHLIGYAACTLIVFGLTHSYYLAFLITLLVNIAYETKDGLFRYEQFGHLGGDGFSFKDLVAGEIGSLMALGLLFATRTFHF